MGIAHVSKSLLSNSLSSLLNLQLGSAIFQVSVSLPFVVQRMSACLLDAPTPHQPQSGGEVDAGNLECRRSGLVLCCTVMHQRHLLKVFLCRHPAMNLEVRSMGGLYCEVPK